MPYTIARPTRGAQEHTYIAAQDKEVAKLTAIVEVNLDSDGELESIVAADVLAKDTWEPIVKVCRWFCKDSGRPRVQRAKVQTTHRTRVTLNLGCGLHADGFFFF